MIGRVVIVTGPPGAGKTTLCAGLAGERTHPAVHLSGDVFFDAIRSGFIPPWLPASREQNRTVCAVQAAAVFGYAAGGFEVFLDGVIGPWHLQPFVDLARTSGAPLHYAVLSADRETVQRRARDRDVDPLPDYPPHIFDGFAELGELERCRLDTQSAPPERVAQTLLEAIAEGRLRLS